jgi:exonuclease SbcC
MKILSIKIKNLASLAGEHCIDFSAQPLAGAGLIAIVGKTGAGKSTILDAMCLALFNQIPRLKHSDGKLQDVDGAELASNSPLTVLRRGSAHGYAEVCFVAQDQQHYLARWEAKRAREKVDGKLQSVQRYLKRLSDGVVLADKPKAVEEQMAQITQLSFEQFSRAVLLAQSEVTIFLKARDKERGELLEYLTNSEIFAKIGELAYAKTAEVTAARKNLEQLMGHVELLSEDAFATLCQQLAAAEQQLQALDTRKRELEQQQRWYQQQQQLQLSLMEQQQRHRQQQADLEQLAPIQLQLQQLQHFASIRPVLVQQQQLQRQAQQQQPQLQRSQLECSQLEQQFQAIESKYQQLEQQLSALQQFEQQHQSELQQIRQLVGQREQIAAQYSAQKNTAKHLDAELQPLNQRRQQQHTAIEQQQIQLQAQAKLLKQSAGFAALDQALPVYLQQIQQFIEHYQDLDQQLQHYPDLAQRRQQLAQHCQDYQHQEHSLEQLDQRLAQQLLYTSQQHNSLNALNLSQQQLQHYLELLKQQQQLEQQLEQEQPKLLQCQAQQQDLEQQVLSAKTQRQQLQQILEQQRLLHSENVEQLRLYLQAQQPCPVCGSCQHPYAEDGQQLSKALFALQQQQLQHAEQLETDRLERLQHCQQRHFSSRSSIEHWQQQLQVLAPKIQQLAQRLEQTWQAQALTLSLQQDPQVLASAFQQQQDQRQQHYQDCLAQQQQMQHNAKDWRDCLQEQHMLHQLEQQALQLRRPMQSILDCSDPTLQQRWLTQPLEVAAQLAQALSLRQHQVQQQSALEQTLEQQQQQLKQLQDNSLTLETQLQLCQSSIAQLQQAGEQNTQRATQLIVALQGPVQIKPHEWLAEHELQLQQLLQQRANLSPSHTQIRQQCQEAQQALARLEALQQQNQQYAAECQQQIQHWLQQHPAFSSSELEHLLQITAPQEQQLRDQIQQAEQALVASQSAQQVAQQQLQQHQQLQPELSLEQIDAQYTQLLESSHSAQQLKDQYKVAIELQQRNQSKQQQFAAQISQIQAQEQRWNKISSLIGDAKGVRFRDLAQQTHLDILLDYANQQLHQLTSRYSLKRLDQSLSLAIIDHDMDDELRSVASLSGGESFLTALALSLAIANMASGSMKIESLFIDEGFGTLDAASLHMVMNALDQLHHQGRQVVLISHIAEMHERIPVQIQVLPQGAGSSHIEIVA